MDENNQQSASWLKNNFLAVAILVAAVLISGSIFYAFGKGGGYTANVSGGKQYPKNAFTACLDSHKYAAAIDADKAAATNAGVQGTPATFINGKFISGAQPWNIFQKAIDSAQPNYWPAQAVDVSSGAKQNNAPAPTGDDVVLGQANAPVTVIEYGDYQCPFCARWFETIEPQLKSTYVDTGKVKFIFRNYPFLGAESEASAEAAECAKDQGAYWAYHNALYTAEAQDGHENNGNLNKDLFVSIASDLKLNAK